MSLIACLRCGGLVLLLIVLLYEVLCFALCLRKLPLIVAGLVICGVYVWFLWITVFGFLV